MNGSKPTEQAINYIWIGNLSSPRNKKLCQLGPKSCASKWQNRIINMWVSQSCIQEACTLFKGHSNIKVLSVEAMLSGQYGKLKHISPDELKKIKQLLLERDEPQYYAAQKDIISFVVIAEYGGYFFDCTTQFINQATLPAVIDFKIILPKTIVDNPAQYLRHPSSPSHSDIWAFAASTPGHQLFTQTVKEIVDDNWDSDDIFRVLGSFGYALRNCYFWAKSDSDWLREHSWEYKQDFIGGSRVPDIGLLKYNHGTWRPIYKSKYRLKITSNPYDNINYITSRMLGIINDSRYSTENFNIASSFLLTKRA